MNSKPDGLLPAIFKTITSAKDSIAEGADFLAKVATDSEVLSQVPVVSTAVKVLNIRDTFARHKLERNVVAFLKAVEDADEKAVSDLHDQIQSDSEYANDFTDTVFSILLEGEKPLKSELVGKLVIALSRKEITKEDFEALSQLIQSAAITTLRALPSFMSSTGGNPYKQGMGQFPEEPLLYSLGIAYRSGAMFRVSPLGEKLYVHGFGGQVST